MLISLEGLSASGKTTIRDLLSQDNDFVVIPTIPGGFEKAREIVDSGHSLNARYLLYLSGVCHQAEQIRNEVRSSNKPVLIESYVYRTLSFYPTLGSKISIGLEDLDIILPDKTFFLNVSNEVRNKRMLERNKHKHSWDVMNEQCSEQMLENYLSYDNYIMIDNSSNNPSLAILEILSQI